MVEGTERLRLQWGAGRKSEWGVRGEVNVGHTNGRTEWEGARIMSRERVNECRRLGR